MNKLVAKTSSSAKKTNVKNSQNIIVLVFSILLILFCMYQDLAMFNYNSFVNMLEDINIKDLINKQITLQSGINEHTVINFFKIAVAVFMIYVCISNIVKYSNQKDNQVRLKDYPIFILSIIVLILNFFIIISNFSMIIYFSTIAFEYNNFTKNFELISFAKDYWNNIGNHHSLNWSSFWVISVFISLVSILLSSILAISFTSVNIEAQKKFKTDYLKIQNPDDTFKNKDDLVPLKPIINITPDLKNKKLNILENTCFWSFDSLTNQKSRFEYLQKQIDKNKKVVKVWLETLERNFIKKDLLLTVNDQLIKIESLFFNFNEMDFIKLYGNIKAKKIIMLAKLFAIIKYKFYCLQLLNGFVYKLNLVGDSKVDVNIEKQILVGFEKSLSKFVIDFKQVFKNGYKTDDELTDALVDVGSEAYYIFCDKINEIIIQ
ncbi:hypothetical protein SGLAD_v1c06810 [Spiroplasma gladiatoris]|uniref:Uncharacterized protein n=1 Tax=Spiroplasma gladiatoris TaxID=2143 RepID=A0A4P7AJZ3_9MOLU|nr:hypothetical protein [Spiroplasma gladiatoris]QBQ07880.1 hypothetical protein SGLAD_v1c06810 [Spiroplasma gladiatoris]